MVTRYVALGLGAILLVLASLAGVDSCRKRQGSQAEVQAAIHQGEANAHQAQAQTSDAAYEDLKAKVDGQKQDLDRLNTERNALLRRLAAKPLPNPNHADHIPGSDALDALEAAIDVRDEIIAKDAEVIQAQAYFIEAQKAEIAVLVVSRDEWKATAEARERQAMAQAEATRAWKQAVTTSRWQGRGEGAVVGALLGLLGGKL